MSELAVAIWLVGYAFTKVWEQAQIPREQRRADAKESPGEYILAGILELALGSLSALT